MEQKNKNRHMIDSVFVISLMLLFVICALSVIAIGAGVYRKNVSLMEANNSRRIASAYITEKVRQGDENGAVFCRELFGQKALVIQQTVRDELYDTYIYEFDGKLMELYARDDLDMFYPQSGQKILDISGLQIEEVSDDLFNVTITLSDGTTDDLFIARRSQKSD